MLWVKAFHIIFVSAWFAGLFYLPRIFVHLAEEGSAGPATPRLLIMAGKLYRFTVLLSIVSLGLGLVLYWGYGVGRGSGNGWMHAKLLVACLVVGYQHACGRLLKKFIAGQNQRTHIWYRWFNEITIILFTAAVCLVVVKPF